ncbi:ImmA/IrrE family metallo-endopeptidase [Streptomyces aureus]|uniref:ImmA/IrrE family metallo-endopeptidase n=1 Tax=Streptomyces aureus TaxID=193461 RepID=UPI0036ADA867
MAPENWPSLKAARTRAEALVHKFDLKPPVDIKALLYGRAQVEYANWSHECDAVTVLGEEKPRVFVRSGLSVFRERFTLAHEMAHIELAWHVGTVDCHIDSTSIGAEFSTATTSGTQEREANEFASRILAPDRWLSSLVSEVSSFDHHAMQSLLDHLATAGLSAQAGLIALSRHLLPGHALFVDQNFAISRGTSWPGAAPLDDAEINGYLERAVSVEEFSHQGRRILWALMVPPTAPISRAEQALLDIRTPHEVLVSSCARVFGEDFAKTKAMSINGVVGGITNDLALQWHENAIVAVVWHRIQDNLDLCEILTDHEFPVYLHRRARAIVEKRASRIAI